jgi:hypothetical protein
MPPSEPFPEVLEPTNPSSGRDRLDIRDVTNDIKGIVVH